MVSLKAACQASLPDVLFKKHQLMLVIHLYAGDHVMQYFLLVIRALLRGLHDPGIRVADVEVRGIAQCFRSTADVTEIAAGL